MQIPPAYLRHIEPIVAKAKGFLENGEALTPVAFVGAFTNNTVIPIMLDSSSEASKNRSSTMIAAAAAQADADYVYTVIEAWALPKKYLNRVEEIYEQYGLVRQLPAPHGSRQLYPRNATWHLDGAVHDLAKATLEKAAHHHATPVRVRGCRAGSVCQLVAAQG